MKESEQNIIIRTTEEKDFPGITALTREVYPNQIPWSETQLKSHITVFPEGQLVAVQLPMEKVVGMASSLIILWDDYDVMENWRDFTDNGMFTNHDPENGHTLYGAEVMVSPRMQGKGIGKRIYDARREIAHQFKLLRIRAGARLRDYHRHSSEMSAEDYVLKVLHGELSDRTLSFQIHQGFRVLAVIPGYLQNDPASLGYAALIEWLNPDLATPEDHAKQNPKFKIPN